ncbi:hypothetical protein FHW58_004703 [Duganella sp. 1224]|uniref:hypothetical protein n=1 Tax=Duganella sp. 1224 TaxID=2587052 RepID=UPI0015CAC6C4|nr:hypothetical protein [Duganella sp. 1224]NYE63473.1 hypothetical protein [Duganella sp. 1224]
MRGAVVFALVAALLNAGPAAAMRARDYLDDQRGPVTLRFDRPTPSIDITPPLDTAAVLTPAGDAQLPPPHARHAHPPPPASPVPEPSGWVMLACGALMLLLVPHRKADAVFDIGKRRR